MRALTIGIALVAATGLARAQDIGAGERIFGQCRGCHQVGEAARSVVGPQLNGLIGRKAGSVEGYAYSPANKATEIVWSEATFRDYIRDPKAAMPGTKMIYAGLKEQARIDDLVAYLKLFDATGKRAAP